MKRMINVIMIQHSNEPPTSYIKHFAVSGLLRRDKNKMSV